MTAGVHIDGETRPGRGAVRQLVDPADAEVAAEISQASQVDTAPAIASAKAAAPGWAARSVRMICARTTTCPRNTSAASRRS